MIIAIFTNIMYMRHASFWIRNILSVMYLASIANLLTAHITVKRSNIFFSAVLAGKTRHRRLLAIALALLFRRTAREELLHRFYIDFTNRLTVLRRKPIKFVVRNLS